MTGKLLQNTLSSLGKSSEGLWPIGWELFSVIVLGANLLCSLSRGGKLYSIHLYVMRSPHDEKSAPDFTYLPSAPVSNYIPNYWGPTSQHRNWVREYQQSPSVTRFILGRMCWNCALILCESGTVKTSRNFCSPCISCYNTYPKKRSNDLTYLESTSDPIHH